MRILLCSSKKKQTRLPMPCLSEHQRALCLMTALLVHDTFHRCRKTRVEAKQRRRLLSTIWWRKAVQTSPGTAMQLYRFRARSARNRGPFLPLLLREAAGTREQVTPGPWKTSYQEVLPVPDTTRSERR